MRRRAFVAVLGSLFLLVGTAELSPGQEGAIKTDLPDVESAMTDYLVNQQDLSGKYCTVVRGKLIRHVDTGIREQDILAIDYRETANDYRYYAMTEDMVSVDLVDYRKWEQWVFRKEEDARVWNAGSMRGQVVVRNKGELSFTARIVDSYYVPLAPMGAFLGSTIDADFGMKIFLLNARFLGQKPNKKGNVVGYWHIGRETGSCAEVTFSKGDKPLPIRIVWRRSHGKVENIESARKLVPYSATETSWKTLQIKGANQDGDVPLSIAVPDTFRAIQYVHAAQNIDLELNLAFQWRFGDECKVARVDDKELVNGAFTKTDWTAGAQKLFDEDWNLLFEDWIVAKNRR